MSENYVRQDLIYKAKIESIIARRCSCEAENNQRIHLGQSIAYNEGSFYELSEELDAIVKEMEED